MHRGTLRGRCGHLVTSSGTLRGRRGTWWHPPSLCVAGVALGDIYFRFAWQVWHLWHCAGSGGALGLGLVAGDAAALCVAGVALGDIQGNFVWQARHLATSTKAMSVLFCAVTAVSDMLWCLCTASWDPAHCSFATHHLSHTALSHRFVTHHLSHTTFTHTHTIFHTKLCHIHQFLCRTPSFTYHFVTHNSSHTTCFTSRSSAISFVFPSFPVPATTFVAHYWKKLTCGVIRSFSFREINYFDWAIFNSNVKLPEGIGFLPSTAGFRKQNHQRRLGQSETNTAIWWKELLGDGWRKSKQHITRAIDIYIYIHNNIHLTIVSGYDSVL